MIGKPALLAMTALALVTACNRGGTANNSAAPGNATSTNSAATTPATGPGPAAAAGGAVDRNFVVGHWGAAGDCSRTLSFNADGTTAGGPLDGATWTLEGNTLSVTEPGEKPEPAQVTRSGDNLALTGPDGQQMTLTRCATAGTGGGSGAAGGGGAGTAPEPAPGK
jgi:hypothetical protein